MSQSNDQGRYARMIAFWGVTLLVMYGCFYQGGLTGVLGRWLGDSNTPFVDPFPLIGRLDLAACIALGVLAMAALGVQLVMRRPRIATALVETEQEMRKVTWPTWGEAWQGTLAVTAMVIVLFIFLTGADLLLIRVMLLLMPGGGS